MFVRDDRKVEPVPATARGAQEVGGGGQSRFFSSDARQRSDLSRAADGVSHWLRPPIVGAAAGSRLPLDRPRGLAHVAAKWAKLSRGMDESADQVVMEMALRAGADAAFAALLAGRLRDTAETSRP